MKGSRITLADIARHAGVSRTAVSYALRDDPNIAASTRARIQAAAEALGYRPDPLLSKLMTHLHAARGRRHVGKLAFLNIHEDSDYWLNTAALIDFRGSAKKRAEALGYKTEEFRLHEPSRSPRRLAQMLIARGIRGLVVGSTGRHGTVVEFPWEKFAAVTVGYSVEQPVLHRVVTHHYRNMRLALRKATDAGYSRIGFVGDRKEEAAMEDQHLAAFLAYQQGLDQARRIPVLWSDRTQPRSLGRWFESFRPDLILGPSILPADLEAAGVRVPEDVALGKLLLWSTDGDGIAGVQPGYERLGAAAIDLLAEQLQHDDFGPPADPKIVQVEGRWRDGPSWPRGDTQ